MFIKVALFLENSPALKLSWLSTLVGYGKLTVSVKRCECKLTVSVKRIRHIRIWKSITNKNKLSIDGEII